MKVKAIVIAMGLAALVSTSAFAASVGSVGESAAVEQIGNGNWAGVKQTASSYDQVNVLQNADGASANVKSSNGGGNVTDIKQIGQGARGASNLSADVTQQQAIGERTTVRQTGHDNSVTVSQTASAFDTDTVKQEGKNASATITRNGSSLNTVNIDQGTNKTAGTSDGAKATVTQTNTIGNRVDVLQGKDNGIATV